METLPPTHYATSRSLYAYYLHIFVFPKFRGDRSMCTRIYRWHHLSLPNAIGILQGRGRDGSNFLETAKMCGFSSAASLPAALCAGGSVFILRAKRCSGGKMENGGLWSRASLPATLGVPARHDRERRCHATAAHSRLPIAGRSQQAAHSSLGSHVTAGTRRTRPASTRPRRRAPSGATARSETPRPTRPPLGGLGAWGIWH